MNENPNTDSYNSIVLFELVKKNAVKNLYYSSIDVVCNEDKLKLAKYLKCNNDKNGFQIVYKHPENKGEISRLYTVPYTGLATFSRPVRGYLIKDVYVDIDMVNCHPCLMQWSFKKYDLSTEYVDAYINNRDAFLKDNNTDKTEVLKMINDKDYVKNNPNCPEVIKKWHNQIYTVWYSALTTDPSNADTVAIVNKSRIKNREGIFVSHYLQGLEFRIFAELLKYAKQNDLHVDCLMHDGFLMRMEDFEESLLIKMADVVNDVFKTNIKLVKKERDSSLDSLVKDVAMNENQVFIDKFLEYCLTHKIRKNGNLVLKPVYDHPMVYEDFFKEENDSIDKNKEKELGLKAFMYHVFIHDDIFNGDPKHCKKLYEYITEKNIFNEFKNYKMSKNYIAVKNGVIQLNPLKFFTLEAVKNDSYMSSLIARNYIDHDYIPDNATPHYDSLIEYQIKDPREIFLLNSLIGKLFFKQNELEFWQIALYLIGRSNTGKSTILSSIAYAMGEKNVGTVGKDDKKFALAGIYYKDLCLIPDLKDAKSIFDEDTVQAMVSSEQVSIRKMGTVSNSKKWEVPLLFGANFMPDWVDSAGALKRRFVFFRFDKLIKDRDTSLMGKIQMEMPNIIFKRINSFYTLMNGTTNGRLNSTLQFDDLITDNLKRIKNEFAIQADPLTEFLSLGPRVIGDYKYDIQCVQDAFTKCSDFKQRFKNWCIHNQHNNYNFDPYATVLVERGFEYKRVYFCKHCDKQRGSGDKCCAMGNKNDRRDLYGFVNMVLVKEQVRSSQVFDNDL